MQVNLAEADTQTNRFPSSLAVCDLKFALLWVHLAGEKNISEEPILGKPLQKALPNWSCGSRAVRQPLKK